MNRLKQHFLEDNDEVGFGHRKNWNAILVMEWVSKHFHVQYSHSGMLVVLRRLNMSFTMPTYTLANAEEINKRDAAASLLPPKE